MKVPGPEATLGVLATTLDWGFLCRTREGWSQARLAEAALDSLPPLGDYANLPVYALSYEAYIAVGEAATSLPKTDLSVALGPLMEPGGIIVFPFDTSPAFAWLGNAADRESPVLILPTGRHSSWTFGVPESLEQRLRDNPGESILPELTLLAAAGRLQGLLGPADLIRENWHDGSHWGCTEEHKKHFSYEFASSDETTHITYEIAPPPGASHWLAEDADAYRSFLAAFALFVRQGGLLDAEPVALPRPARRRLARAGFNNNLVISVLPKRRPRRSDQTHPTETEWSHRWVVRGHWRNHWWPKEQEHRPRWIDPHIKGPENKPLIEKRHGFVVVGPQR